MENSTPAVVKESQIIEAIKRIHNKIDELKLILAPVISENPREVDQSEPQASTEISTGLKNIENRLTVLLEDIEI